ncbi:MAG: DUF192 domain-containing protein [Rickettsiales bacterium]
MKRFLLALAFFFAAQSAQAVQAETIPVTIGQRHYNVEIAADTLSRERGLSKRSAIGTDGMLFAFPDVARRKFWMKDTLVPLDILFISPDRKIVFIGHGEPKSLTPIGPDAPGGNVIELDGGRAEADAIHVGDTVTYEIPASILVR